MSTGQKHVIVTREYYAPKTTKHPPAMAVSPGSPHTVFLCDVETPTPPSLYYSCTYSDNERTTIQLCWEEASVTVTPSRKPAVLADPKRQSRRGEYSPGMFAGLEVQFCASICFEC